ncbi:MAG: acyltransferase [Lachnospiraceae bacterium]|nr:acyltransferase [Lachnospiraceae bacterium]
MSKKSKERLYNLDWLRFFASVIIVIHHFQQITGAEYLAIFGSFGWVTELFFIVSGFLAADNYDKKKTFKEYIIPKYAKFIPMCWLTMTVFAGIVFSYYAYTGEWIDNQKYDLATVITSYLFCNQGWLIDFSVGLNNPIWYIDVLILCYILIFVINKYARSTLARLIIYILIVVAVYLAVFVFSFRTYFFWWSTQRGLIGFFLGAVFQKIYKIEKNALYYLGIPFLLVFIYSLINGKALYAISFICLMSFIVILALVVKQIHANEIVSVLAYEAYLWHCPVFLLIVAFDKLFNIGINYSILFMIISIIVIELFSYLMYICYEIPVAKKVKKLSDRLTGNSAE